MLITQTHAYTSYNNPSGSKTFQHFSEDSLTLFREVSFLKSPISVQSINKNSTQHGEIPSHSL